MTDEPRILIDHGTGRPVLMAPHRRQRPILTGDKTGVCPFCAGHEEHTPHELDAVRTPGTGEDTPDWSVRAFPNLYPASAHHLVIAEGAEHHQQPSALPATLWEDALALYRRRILALEAEPEICHAYLFKNVGQRAGASIEHNHTQILGLPMLPPRLELELAQQRARGECLQCRELEDAAGEDRIVHQGEHHVIYCPSVPKLPFETVLAPVTHGDRFLEGNHAGDLATTLHTLFRIVDKALGSPPFNMFLHRIPGEDFHWHIELQPRTGNLAGLEIGGDMYINALPGNEAAAQFRNSL